jgi:toxin FitB
MDRELPRHDPDQAEVFATWLAELQTRFAARILAIVSTTADEWGRLNAPTDRKTVHSLIAATTRVHQLTVVMRNTVDFKDCDVPLLDPWSDQATPARPQP